MKPSGPRLQHLRDPKKLRILASPLALQILNALQGQAEATAAEIAEQVARPREVIYYHLRRLVEAGFIREVGQRATTRRPVNVYRAVATDVRIDASGSSPAWRDALIDVYRAALRSLERDVRASIRAGHRPGKGAVAEFIVTARHVRLDEEGLREMNVLIAAVTEAVLRRATARSGPVYSFGLALAPVRERKNSTAKATPRARASQ